MAEQVVEVTRRLWGGEGGAIKSIEFLEIVVWGPSPSPSPSFIPRHYVVLLIWLYSQAKFMVRDI